MTSTSSPKSAPRSESGGPRQLLIIDRKWEGFTQVYEATADLGVEQKWATTFEEAIAVLETVPIDIVIADTEFRDPEGHPVTRTLKNDQRWKGIHTILLVTPGQVDDSIYGPESGADDFLFFPVQTATLRARIQVALRSNRITSELRALERQRQYEATVVTIAHELNNPLTSLIGNLELVRDDLEEHLSGPARESILAFVTEIENNADRIKRVVAKLQRLSEPKLESYPGGAEIVRMLDTREEPAGE